MIVIAKNIEADTKTKKIGARVTPGQKAAVKKRMNECGYKYESEYVLTCCLQGCNVKPVSDYQIRLLEQGTPDRLEVRVTEEERRLIVRRYEESGVKNFSRYVRNCCLNNPIIVVIGFKELTEELNRIGNNLNQITMLCHQGLITAPDLTGTQQAFKHICQEVVNIKIKHRLKR